MRYSLECLFSESYPALFLCLSDERRIHGVIVHRANDRVHKDAVLRNDGFVGSQARKAAESEKANNHVITWAAFECDIFEVGDFRCYRSYFGIDDSEKLSEVDCPIIEMMDVECKFYEKSFIQVKFWVHVEVIHVQGVEVVPVERVEVIKFESVIFWTWL